MNNFTFQPESIQHLAILVLTASMVAYLWSIKGKSKATKWLFLSVIGFFIMELIPFLHNSLAERWLFSDLYRNNNRTIFFAGTALAYWPFMMFSYHFLENPFKKEVKYVNRFAIVVLSATLILFIYDITFGEGQFQFGPLAFLLHVSELFLLSVIGIWVLIRKIRLSPDSSRKKKAYKSYIILYCLSTIYFMIVLYAYIFKTYEAGIVVLQSLLFVSFIFGLLLVYLNNSTEPTSFQIKLIGLSLVTVLAVFSILPYVFHTADFLYQIHKQNLTVSFTPEATGGYKVTELSESIDTTSLGNKISMGDEQAERIRLPFLFPFSEKQWDKLYISPNGAVTFGDPIYKNGRPYYNPLFLTNGIPKIAPFYSDFDPSQNGSVYVKKEIDQIFITWYRVPPFGEDNQENSIQLKLTKDGEITFRYGRIESARIFVLDVPSFMAIIPSNKKLNLHEVLSNRTTLPGQLEAEGAWIQSIGVEAREIIHAIVTNLIWLMIGFVAFILLIFPFFYHSSLVQPINNLLHGVRKVNEGDLDTEVQISVKDEIGYLTHNFNKMTQSLRSYNEEMESLVSERTAKLEKSLKNLQAAQQKLVQQEKLASLGQLTAGIAHEIKNPLNFVNNFSDLSMELIEETKEEIKNTKKRINNSSDEGSKIQEIIKTIETNLEIVETNLSKISNHGLRADGIVKSMLQHSRGGSEKVEPIDLNMLVKEYVNLAFHGMRASPNPINVDIDLKLDETIGKVPLIAEDFSRVIVNICNNAFDAMREKGKTPKGLTRPDYNPALKVRTKRSNNHISIEIEDNGIGIPEEIKEDVLQPFFTTKKGTQGTGLGLSITHDILKAHGGEISIESEYKSYTLFKILLNTNHDE